MFSTKLIEIKPDNLRGADLWSYHMWYGRYIHTL